MKESSKKGQPKPGGKRASQDPATSERLERIESMLAHLERQYEELNQVIIEQSRVLKRLAAQQQRLSDSVETNELERIKATNPKPPHYQ